jgi:hypothetical protein
VDAIGVHPREVRERWPSTDADALEGSCLSRLPIDFSVGSCGVAGGAKAARREAARFVDQRLHRYADEG